MIGAIQSPDLVLLPSSVITMKLHVTIILITNNPNPPFNHTLKHQIINHHFKKLKKVQEGAEVDTTHINQAVRHFGDCHMPFLSMLLSHGTEYVAQRVVNGDKSAMVMQCANPSNAVLLACHLDRWERMDITCREVTELTRDGVLKAICGSDYQATILFRTVVVMRVKQAEEELRMTCEVLTESRTVDQEVKETLKRKKIERLMQIRRSLMEILVCPPVNHASFADSDSIRHTDTYIDTDTALTRNPAALDLQLQQLQSIGGGSMIRSINTAIPEPEPQPPSESSFSDAAAESKAGILSEEKYEKYEKLSDMGGSDGNGDGGIHMRITPWGDNTGAIDADAGDSEAKYSGSNNGNNSSTVTMAMNGKSINGGIEQYLPPPVDTTTNNNNNNNGSRAGSRRGSSSQMVGSRRASLAPSVGKSKIRGVHRSFLGGYFLCIGILVYWCTGAVRLFSFGVVH